MSQNFQERITDMELMASDQRFKFESMSKQLSVLENMIKYEQVNAKKQNMMLGSWTVNKDEDFNKLVAQGVEFITTNFPERYLTIKKAPR